MLRDGRSGKRQRRLSDGYSFGGFRAKEPLAVCSVIRMCGYCVSIGAQKNAVRGLRAGLERLVRPAGAAGSRPAERRVSNCSGTRRAAHRVPALWTVKRERLDFLADNPHFTKRFAFYVGRRCRQASIRDVAKELSSTGTRSRRWRCSICGPSCVRLLQTYRSIFRGYLKSERYVSAFSQGKPIGGEKPVHRN